MEEESRKVLKICHGQRRVGVVASNIEMLKEKCTEKFGITSLRFVLLEDGTEVDEEYFQTLPQDTCLMALEEGKEWTAEEEPKNMKKRNLDENENDTNVKVLKLMETLRDKGRRGDKPSASGKQKQKLLSVNVGWMHYSYREQKYKLIKATREHPASGPRITKLDPSQTMSALLVRLKEIFFPEKRSPLGHEKKFTFSVGNFKGEALDPEMTLESYANDLSKPSIYLQTKQESLLMINTDSSSDSDFELPAFTFPKTGNHQTANIQEDEILNLQVLETLPMPSSSSLPNFVSADTPNGASQNNAIPTVMQRDTGTPTVTLRLPAESSTCPICYDRKKDTVVIPCGHPLCHPCAVYISENDQRCPMCRQTVDKISCVTA
ncbi:uncharacterized protein LOC123538901 [Mercenaria mercenaria]|uniref:uncharacterized protein LOC123538901 n=1 Tax=Mercenaria mercenaria TaxID=6596 RepID=UPI00234F7688|nr:uncharacterized protein LOC123538901 [Mercenaria mercenaria]